MPNVPEKLASPILATELAPESVDSAHIKNGAVIETKLAAAAVSEEKIAEKAVTEEKIEEAQRMSRTNVEKQQSVKPAESTNSNVFLGTKAGEKLKPKGEANVFVGEEAGELNTTGSNNVIIGNGAGKASTTGSKNVFIGNHAGAEAGTGCEQNIAIGTGAAGEGALTGKKNVVIGQAAGEKLSSGGSNVLIGFQAGNSLTTTSNKLVVTNNETKAIIEGVMSATEASQEIGFLGSAPVKRPKVKGNRTTEIPKVLETLCKGLAELGLITDETA